MANIQYLKNIYFSYEQSKNENTSIGAVSSFIIVIVPDLCKNLKPLKVN